VSFQTDSVRAAHPTLDTLRAGSSSDTSGLLGRFSRQGRRTAAIPSRALHQQRILASQSWDTRAAESSSVCRLAPAGSTSRNMLAASTPLHLPNRRGEIDADKRRAPLATLLDQLVRLCQCPRWKSANIDNNCQHLCRRSEYVRCALDSLPRQYICRLKSNYPVLFQTSSCSTELMDMRLEELEGRIGIRRKCNLAASQMDIQSEASALRFRSMAAADNRLSAFRWDT